jgi:hypothetical protein
MPQAGPALPKISSVQQIVELPGWERALRSLQEQREWVDRVQIELTEIPAPTFQESARAQYMAERFRELGLQRVRLDAEGRKLRREAARSLDKRGDRAVRQVIADLCRKYKP